MIGTTIGFFRFFHKYIRLVRWRDDVDDVIGMESLGAVVVTLYMVLAFSEMSLISLPESFT